MARALAVTLWNLNKKEKIHCGFVRIIHQCSNIGAVLAPRGQPIFKSTEIATEATQGVAVNVGKLGGKRKPKENFQVYASVLQGCVDTKSIRKGREVHGHIVKAGFELNLYLQTKLVILYAKCGELDVARQVFDKMPERNEVSWNGLIAGYSQHSFGKEALILFSEMRRAGMNQDEYSFASVIKACASLEAMEDGKQVHACIVKARFQSHVYVSSALVDMYAKCRNTDHARHVFDKMSQKNVVSWNAMIAGYAQQGYGNGALTLFYQMHQAGMKSDQFTFASALRACATLAALELGKQLHACTIKNARIESDIFLGNALVNMYSKCGSIEDARHVYDKMSCRDVVSWTAMIAGYGRHGCGKEVVQLFEQMQLEGMKPDYITFVALLSACSHAGLVDEGWHYFYSMSQDHCITPREEHYACMVDLFGRAGRLKEAWNIIKEVPFEPTAAMWGALLGACRNHDNTELGKHAAEQLFELDPQRAGNYVVLSNIYAAAGRWEDATKVREMMKHRGVKKEPGCSWIEVKKRIHDFVIGDKSHPQTEEIYSVLERLAEQMKKTCYRPNTNFVLHDVEEEQKEHALYYHSEKLAIAFGLTSIPVGEPIRIIKNLRVCGDCHTAIKFISRIAGREIIVRDANRFHHFKDELCSCGDYW